MTGGYALGDPDPFQQAIRKELFAPLNLNGAIRTEEVTVQFENNSQADSLLRNVDTISGSASVTFSDGRFLLETTANGTDAVARETASIGEYAAGLAAASGLQIVKENDPVGFAEWGYGGDAFNDEARFHLASDGSYRFDRVKGGTVTEIPQSLWTPDTDRKPVQDEDSNTVGVVTGLDPLDGTGDSEADISTPVLGLFGVDMVLYGGGGLAPWFVDLTANKAVEKIYPFVFHPTNENVFEQFNQPIFARLDNDGTATADSLSLTERQFTRFGANNGPERGTQHCFDRSDTISSPTCMVGVRRADPGGGTRLDFLDVLLSVDQPSHVWFIVAPDVTANGGDSNWSLPQRDFDGTTTPAKETKIEVNETLEVDATTGVGLDGGVVEGSSDGGPPDTRVTPDTTSFRSSPFIRDKPVAIMIEPFAGASDATSQEGIVNVNEGF